METSTKHYMFKIASEFYRCSENQSKILSSFIDFLHITNFTDNMIEGGFVSPDNSTIIIYGRSPYYFHIMPFNRDIEAYNRYITMFLNLDLIREVSID